MTVKSNKPMAHVASVTASLDELMPLIEERLAAGQSVEIYPMGVSMRPLLREGKDSVVLAPLAALPQKNDIVLVRLDGKYILHRMLARARDGSCVLCGDNCITYERGVFERHVLARVSAIKRDGKHVALDSRQYHFYLKFVTVRRRCRRLMFRVGRKLRRAFGRKSKL